MFYLTTHSTHFIYGYMVLVMYTEVITVNCIYLIFMNVIFSLNHLILFVVFTKKNKTKNPQQTIHFNLQPYFYICGVLLLTPICREVLKLKFLNTDFKRTQMFCLRFIKA